MTSHDGMPKKTKERKNKMAEKKQTKKIKVRDLKPRKDTKGGMFLGPTPHDAKPHKGGGPAPMC
jgi:hypothetical protein